MDIMSVITSIWKLCLVCVCVCALYNTQQASKFERMFHFVDIVPIIIIIFVDVVGVFFSYLRFRSLVAYTISACRIYLYIFIETTKNKWEFFISRLKWSDKMLFWVFHWGLSIKRDQLGIKIIFQMDGKMTRWNWR
jgi:hypothetical protein